MKNKFRKDTTTKFISIKLRTRNLKKKYLRRFQKTKTDKLEKKFKYFSNQQMKIDIATYQRI